MGLTDEKGREAMPYLRYNGLHSEMHVALQVVLITCQIPVPSPSSSEAFVDAKPFRAPAIFR